MQTPTTPKEISDEILKFCRSISVSEPFFVNVQPESFSKPSFCFPNVQEQIIKKGGQCVYGWQIWESACTFIEAEFHAIWKSLDNVCIDITPKKNNEKKILFLPDPRCIYEDKQVNNIREPLSSNGLIPHYLLTFDALFHLQNYGKRENQSEVKLVGEEYDIYQWLIHWQGALQQMIISGLSINSTCPCGSNLKYKRCCGKAFEESMAELKMRYSF